MSARTDKLVFALFLTALAMGAVLFGRANLMADSVDYYATLHRISPVGGAPIVGNLHFADQRSPGFAVAAFVPHLLLVAVERITGTRTRAIEGDGPPGLIPSAPLLLNQVPFHDFEVPEAGSVYRWTIALALALTSYGFFFAGVAALGSTLKREFPALPGYTLIVAMVVACPMLAMNLFATPLYATLTAFGASAFFARAYWLGNAVQAGAWLGLVVLTRLETAVFAVALGAILLWQCRGFALRMTAGALWAAVAWAAYNWHVFGTPLSFEILRGDINILRVDAAYIMRCLLHPASGLLFWSAPVVVGMVALARGRHREIAWAAAPLVMVWLVRMPVMLLPEGQAPAVIGGIPVMPPMGPDGALQLIRSDVNRYATVLAPTALLGLRDALATWPPAWFSRLRRGR